MSANKRESTLLNTTGGREIGGGPSQEQKQAAASQANLTNEAGQAFLNTQRFQQAQQEKANPFYTSRMQNGLPYFNMLTDAVSGTTARAFAPARQQLYQSLGTQQGLPSGFRQQMFADLDANQARAFDANLQAGLAANEQAKQAGASGILGQAQIANPQGYLQSAMGGNQSIMQAPLQRPGIAGLLGGIAGGLASNPAF